MEGISDGDVDDETVKAAVADEQVAAAAEDEDRKLTLASELNGFEELGLAGDFAEISGRTANTERGVGSERHLLLDVENGRGHGLEGTSPVAGRSGVD